jgi:hypothetical protein
VLARGGGVRRGGLVEVEDSSSMQQHETGGPPRGRLVTRAATLFVAALAAAYGLAPSEHTRPAAPAASDAARAAADVRQQVEELLARGGCPGWIALANDPDVLAAPAAKTPDKPWHETAAHERTVPRATYPQPVRAPQYVAAHISSSALVAQAPSSDGDELISEADDLLLTSPEVRGGRPTAPAAKAPAAVSTPAAQQPKSEAPPQDAAVSAPPTDGKEYSPQELLRDKPVAGSHDDDLIDEAEDLLKDTGDLLVPVPTPGPVPKPAPIAPTPSAAGPPASSSPASTPPASTPPQNVLPAPAEPLIAPPPGPGPSRAPSAGSPGVAPHSVAPKAIASGATSPKPGESRCECVARSLYPSATECRACHEKIYDEWSMSSHAYAFVSPMFHRFEQTINDLSSGTIGYFCYRCHTPAGTSLGISRAAPIWDAPLVAREGVTCVACHRINEMYGKTNGERRIVPGDIYAPVYGSIGGDGVAAAVADKNQFKVKTSPDEPGPGQPMHAAAFSFPQLSASEFCMSCHQVAVYPGIKLEVVWEQYRASPACKKGISCQDCHMGRIPGVPSGYDCGPAALVNNKSVNAGRKHSNHVFYGPGYSIAHPGVFPQNPKNERWSARDWLLFDWRAGWGADAFEDAVADGQIQATFPDVWKESDDRCDAREIIEDNLKKRAKKDRLRSEVMENGSHVEGPYFEGPQVVGQDLKFNFVITNTNDGHNLPTASLGAQPQLWANVAIVGPRGNRVWESGYMDSLGDLADIHSEDVRHKRIAYDWQLFNLQTMFLITGAKGTDREFFLPVNIDIDPLPFIRPAGQPVSVINHPPFIRMEARSLAPLGSRRVPYRVPGAALREPGRYRLSFRMRSRTEPLYFMRFCGSSAEMQQAMNEGILDFHQVSVEFEVR